MEKLDRSAIWHIDQNVLMSLYWTLWRCCEEPWLTHGSQRDMKALMSEVRWALQLMK